jgi:hypothetical protein
MKEEDGYLLSGKATKLQETLPQAYVFSRQLKTDSSVPSALALLLKKQILIP